MPTYQYACTECDHRFETVQSFSEDSLTECPQCTGRLRKLFNAVGIVFKGSGFYRTDNRSNSNSGSGSSSGSSSSGESKSSGSSSDSSSSSSSSSSSGSSSSSSSTTAAAS
ncbi:FmdB family transcriptional regulator [Saccharopolyspora sp. NFXS83]|uniref:FmdB family zinc ribbon protein n=1 Tax=Saccharopolyspora sp. NFXS83 TaxID=2993560 RepID=UPI00224A6947|nr:FmdB family zinc ribbon protein [Saccharopolyspora sp. NFXS83]MCX2732034.1 FmdB family transcriptional regulator [Saccharopolyspora sp. NFXS83]